MVRRVLVTGRGSIARRHVAQLRMLLPDVEIALIARNGQVDEVLQPCEIFLDFESSLQWEPDAVVIASVSGRHAQELLVCLESGLPCLVEKPVALSRSELALLRKAHLRPEGGPVQVGCNLRHLPALGRLRAFLAGGELGALVRAHFEVGQNLAQWRPGRDLATSYSANADQGGGVVFDLVHEIDMARWLLGPLCVKASLSGHLSKLPLKCDDVHVSLLVSTTGAAVTVSLDYVSQRPVRRYVFVAERGTVTCDLMNQRTVLADENGERVIDTDLPGFDISQTYHAQMVDWLSAVAWGRALVCPLDDGFETIELMLSMKGAL